MDEIGDKNNDNGDTSEEYSGSESSETEDHSIRNIDNKKKRLKKPCRDLPRCLYLWMETTSLIVDLKNSTRN